MVWSDSNNNSSTHVAPRRRFNSSYSGAVDAVNTNSKTICVVDPYSRKLEIPRHQLHETNALHRVGIPSVCMLFLDGRCKFGHMCHQAHVDPEVIDKLRKEAMARPTCCMNHGDLHSSSLTKLLGGRSLYLNDREIPMGSVANTLGLQRLLRESTDGVIQCNPQSICRLHLSDKCRYVEECNHIHICRDLRGAVLQKQHAAPVSPLIAPCDDPREEAISASSTPTADVPMPRVLSPSQLLSPTRILSPTVRVLSPDSSRWSHSPYQWQVLDEYDYMPHVEKDLLSPCSNSRK